MNPVSQLLAERDLEAASNGRPPSTGSTLASLRRGERAVVARVVAHGDVGAAHRLFDLGFRPGATVERVRRAPLGDPTVYRIADYEVALRKAQAACIEVER